MVILLVIATVIVIGGRNSTTKNIPSSSIYSHRTRRTKKLVLVTTTIRRLALEQERWFCIAGNKDHVIIGAWAVLEKQDRHHASWRDPSLLQLPVPGLRGSVIGSHVLLNYTILRIFYGDWASCWLSPWLHSWPWLAGLCGRRRLSLVFGDHAGGPGLLDYSEGTRCPHLEGLQT